MEEYKPYLTVQSHLTFKDFSLLLEDFFDILISTS